MQEIFAPLRDALHARPADAAGFLQIVAGFITMDRPLVAHAMASHMSDILSEKQEDTEDWSRAVAEAYWRTFYEEAGSSRYGTGELLASGEDNMRQFTEMLLLDIAGEKFQDKAGSFHAEPSTKQ